MPRGDALGETVGATGAAGDVGGTDVGDGRTSVAVAGTLVGMMVAVAGTLVGAGVADGDT